MDPAASAHQILCLKRSVVGTLAVVRQAFGEESISYRRKLRVTETEKGETDQEQSESCAHHFL
jgi:hypothetical protein